MNSKVYKSIFIVLGVLTLSIMIYKLGYKEILINISKTGYWFIPIIGSWLLIYVLNALAFNKIIYEAKNPKTKLAFLKVLRLTITGYAINYITPFVALGGEPYRIMELKSSVGLNKATSSVLLYGMMHIFSHIIFWLISIPLILLVLPIDQTLLAGCLIAFLIGLVITFWFLRVYKNGFTVSTFTFLQKLPFIKKRISIFVNEKQEFLNEIDNQIIILYTIRKQDFYLSLVFEILARVVTCAEIYFTALAIEINMTVFEAIIISSASSLFANIVFFFPMQLGVREGGLALALKSINLPGEAGIFIGLIMRIREIAWIIIGLVLIKVSKNKVDY